MNLCLSTPAILIPNGTAPIITEQEYLTAYPNAAGLENAWCGTIKMSPDTETMHNIITSIGSQRPPPSSVAFCIASNKHQTKKQVAPSKGHWRGSSGLNHTKELEDRAECGNAGRSGVAYAPATQS
jgi:hypothetical protein